MTRHTLRTATLGRANLGWALVLMLVLAPVVRAEDEEPKKDRQIAPEQAARMILLGEGPQQMFLAQYLERAKIDELLESQAAIRALAPKVADELTARVKTPLSLPEGPVDVVSMEVRIIEIPLDCTLFEDIGVKKLGQVTLLDEVDLEVVARIVEKDIAQLITAPRLTTYDGQRANISVVKQMSYIQDFDVEVMQDQWIADPVIGIVQEGVVLDIRPTLSADKKTITLDFDGTWAWIQKPISEREIVVKDDQKVRIQLPKIEVGSSHVRATLPDGGAMIVRSNLTFGEGDEKVQRAAIVMARRFQLTEDELEGSKKDVKKMNDEYAPGVRIKKQPGAPAGSDAPDDGDK